MPVPKRKTSKKRKNQRSSTKFIRAKAFTSCSNCSIALNPHQACLNCGFYKGKKVMKTKLDRVLKRGQNKKTAEMHEHKDQNQEQENKD